MAWWYSEGCLRDSAVLLGPKCSYIVLRLGIGQDMLAMEGHRGSLKISRRNPCSPFLVSVIA